jgi:hypothetical protein
MKVVYTHRVAIITKYLPPTYTKGARIKASANKNSITISYDYAKSGDDPHVEAALALCKKMGWADHELIAGGTDTGCVFVIKPKTRKTR